MSKQAKRSKWAAFDRRRRLRRAAKRSLRTKAERTMRYQGELVSSAPAVPVGV